MAWPGCTIRYQQTTFAEHDFQQEHHWEERYSRTLRVRENLARDSLNWKISGSNRCFHLKTGESFDQDGEPLSLQDYQSVL